MLKKDSVNQTWMSLRDWRYINVKNFRQGTQGNNKRNKDQAVAVRDRKRCRSRRSLSR